MIDSGFLHGKCQRQRDVCQNLCKFAKIVALLLGFVWFVVRWPDLNVFEAENLLSDQNFGPSKICSSGDARLIKTLSGIIDTRAKLPSRLVLPSLHLTVQQNADPCRGEQI
jgi:hypothetical protein